MEAATAAVTDSRSVEMMMKYKFLSLPDVFDPELQRFLIREYTPRKMEPSPTFSAPTPRVAAKPAPTSVSASQRGSGASHPPPLRRCRRCRRFRFPPAMHRSSPPTPLHSRPRRSSWCAATRSNLLLGHILCRGRVYRMLASSFRAPFDVALACRPLLTWRRHHPAVTAALCRFHLTSVVLVMAAKPSSRWSRLSTRR